MQLENSTLVIAGVGGALGLYFIRRYFKGGQFTEKVSLKGKVAVVTGCNTGIGYETAKELNLRGAKVYMLCRTEKRAEEAKSSMVKKGCDASRLIYVNLDLGSFENIRECAKRFEQLESHIDILVNNAGMIVAGYEMTRNGHEMTWQTNHLGPFLLTELLLPLVESAPAGRIVNVASLASEQCPAAIDLSSIDSKDYFGSIMTAYGRTKLANVMHARELHRRLRSKGNMTVTVNSLHPGAILTDIGRNMSTLVHVIAYALYPLVMIMMKTRRDGAQTSLYLAMSKEVEGVSGCYFADCTRKLENPNALNDLACKQLYDYSLKAVGLA